MVSKIWVGIAAVLLGVMTLGACGNSSPSADTSESASPSAAATVDATAEATELANQYLTMLQNGDAAGLETLLSPAFQVIRADGSSADKTAYLADPPKIEEFTVSDMVATQQATALVARYNVTTTETVNGEKYSNEPAPRLSVFIEQGGTWQLIAHANLNTPDTVSAPTSAAPSPWAIRRSRRLLSRCRSR